MTAPTQTPPVPGADSALPSPQGVSTGGGQTSQRGRGHSSSTGYDKNSRPVSSAGKERGVKVRGSGKDQGESTGRHARHRKTIKINALRNSITDMQRRSKQALRISLWGAGWGGTMDTMLQPGDTVDGGGGRVLSVPWPHLHAAQVTSF